MEKKHLMGLFILGIMSFSVFGIALNYVGTNGDKVKINGNTFRQQGAGWVTFLNDKRIIVTTDPRNLQESNVPDISFTDLNKYPRIYLTTNSSDYIPQEALFSLQNNIIPYTNKMNPACIEDSEQCKDLPLKNCLDSNQDELIIQLQSNENSLISFDSGCLLIQGDSLSMAEQIDALSLELHDII